MFKKLKRKIQSLLCPEVYILEVIKGTPIGKSWEVGKRCSLNDLHIDSRESYIGFDKEILTDVIDDIVNRTNEFTNYNCKFFDSAEKEDELIIKCADGYIIWLNIFRSKNK